MLNTGEKLNQKTGDTKVFNSNVFIKEAPKEKSFSDQLNELQKANVEQELNQAKLNTSGLDNKNQGLLNEQAQKIVSALSKEGINISPEEAIQLIEQRKLDLKKEQQGLVSSEALKQDAHEVAKKSSSNEAAIATAMQANQDEAKDAIQEGNVAQQEQAQDDSANDRKTQLANWDMLTPRVIEDIKNKAVRIDIPGIKDISTIVVRMRGNQISIQAAGSETAMKLLQGGQGELNSRLNQHNVQLSELKTIDSSRLKRKSA